MKTDHLATRIAGRILRRQQNIAGYLNHKTQHWNKTSKLVALALFVLLFGGACLGLIIHAFIK